jgi:hypothetical protein
MTTLSASIILVWDDENPHAILWLRHQHQFQIVLAGMVGGLANRTMFCQEDSQEQHTIISW